MKPRLIYLSKSALPSRDANAVHVAQMCDAFAGLDRDVCLHALPGGGEPIRAYYDLRHAYAIRAESRLEHRRWLLARWLRRQLPPRGEPRLYYGRRLSSLSRLAQWGYATALELHHPPRNAGQEAALRRFVAAPGFRGLVVISESLRAAILARLPALHPSDVLVAHDGVRADRIRAPRQREAGPLRAVYCGSFHAGKGVEHVIAAASMLPTIRFDLIGGSPQQIAALRTSAPDNLRFLGHLPHAECQAMLPTYDLALAPYGRVVRGTRTPEQENLSAWMSPLKLFEYMGAGLPVISSDLPVLRELLADRETARLVPPDDVAALAGAIAELADDPALRLQLAENAHQQLQAHTWENRAREILDFVASRRQVAVVAPARRPD